MRKILFILQEKQYNLKIDIYIKILKHCGYEIHIFINKNCKTKYFNNQQIDNFNIFKLRRCIKNYEMVFCDSKIIEIIMKIINFKEKNRIIHVNIKAKMNLKNTKETEYKIDDDIKSKKYIFCSIGTFNKSNNQIMQLESMIRIIKKYPQVKLMLIGQGKLKDYYEHIIDKYGLSENVEIVENMSFKIDIIKKSNCIISTRKREEFALDNIIAIILNKPILVSNVGINKLIFKQENIFYNSDELKEKMKSNIEENKDFEKYYDIELNEREEILKSESI